MAFILTLMGIEYIGHKHQKQNHNIFCNMQARGRAPKNLGFVA